MLDELVLRACRRLVCELEARDLWLDDATFRALRSERATAGGALLDSIVVEALGRDADALGAEYVFGVGNFRFRSRLPLSLAFGSDVATTIANPLPHAARASDVAAMAALFNFGIALLDRMLDTLNRDAHHTAQLLEEPGIDALVHDPAAHRAVLAAAESLSSVEARIVVKIVCAFFARFHIHPDAQLGALLLETYRAEMRCTRAIRTTLGAADLLVAANRKSTLPFAVIGRLAGGGAEPAGLVADLGTVFWRVDDLVDLWRDLESGDVNGLLLEAAAGSGEPALEEDLVRRLLESDVVDAAVEAVCASLGSVAHAVAPPAADLMMMYVRNWIPKRIFGGRVRPRN